MSDTSKNDARSEQDLKENPLTLNPVEELVSIETKILPPKAKVKKQKKALDSMTLVIESAISNHRLALTDKIFRDLRDRHAIAPEERERLLALAAEKDLNLNLARLFMHAAVQAYSYPRVADSFRFFARDLICQHPLVSEHSTEFLPASENMHSGSFTSLAKRIGKLRDEASRKIKDIPNTKLEEKPPVTKEKKKETRDDRKLYENLLFATASWWFAYKMADTTEVVAGLCNFLFSSKSKDRDLHIDVLTFLDATHDRKGFGAFYKWNQEVTEELSRQRRILVDNMEIEAQKNAKLNSKINDLSTLKDNYSQKIVELEGHLTTERAERRIEKIHLIDEKEQVKAHANRTIEADLKLLTDALTAITREPPKTNITVDYLKTVIESLSSELNYLRGV